MKEKRYYCDWALSPSNEKSNRLMSKVLLISLVVVTTISSLIYYNIMMYRHGEDLEAAVAIPISMVHKKRDIFSRNKDVGNIINHFKIRRAFYETVY